MCNETLLLNTTDITCPMSLLWKPDIIANKQSHLYVCCIALGSNSIFWIQLIFHSSIRHISMQWIYSYLITDIFLIIRFFFIYIVHTRSTDCYPTKAWILFVCYFEVIVSNYFNVLEVYILLALNVCRYIQIVHNRNVYILYRSLLIVIHLCIYLIPLVAIAISLIIGWTRVHDPFRNSCTIHYASIYIEVFNIIFAFGMPIFLNILVIYLCVRDVRLKSKLSSTRNFSSARQKYHRTLIIQFISFYILWIVFWSPNIILYQIAIQEKKSSDAARLLNLIEVAIDPIIVSTLDVRLLNIWQKFISRIKLIIMFKKPNSNRIEPLPTDLNKTSMKTTQQNTMTR